MSNWEISLLERANRFLRWTTFVIACSLSAACGLLLLGAHSTSIPYLSFYGALGLSLFSPWLVLIPLMSAVVIGAAAFQSIRRVRNCLVIFALLIAAVGAMAVKRMLDVASENSIPIKLWTTLDLRPIGRFPPNQSIVYATFDGQPVYMALYSAQRQWKSPSAPILMYVHGGGWTQGDAFDFGQMMRWFASQGWLVLSVGYPLSTPQRHLWDKTTAQIGCALAWTNAHAAQYGGDPRRISMLGQSAGGNLVLNASSQANAGTLLSNCEGAVPHVAAVVAVYPAVHLVEAYHSKVPGISDVGRAFIEAYTGGTPERFPDRYAFIDPASHISGASPPTLIMVGEHDDLLPPQPTYRFADELRAAGVHVELLRFPYGQHAYDVVQGSIGDQLTLGMTRKFLLEQGQGSELRHE